jgi:hypothetical protein
LGRRGKGLPKGIGTGGRGLYRYGFAGIEGIRKGQETGVEPDTAPRFAPAGAVFKVPLDGEPEGGELGADLMTAAGKKFYLCKKIAVPPAQEPKTEGRPFQARFLFGIGGGPVPPPVRPDPVDQFPLPGNLKGRRRGFQNRPVTFLHAPLGKGSAQEPPGPGSTGKEEAARNGHIEAVRRSQPFLPQGKSQEPGKIAPPLPGSLRRLTGEFVHHQTGPVHKKEPGAVKTVLPGFHHRP